MDEDEKRIPENGEEIITDDREETIPGDRNETIPDDVSGSPEETGTEETGPEDEYAFMTETVRKRPGGGKKVCLSILTVLLGGVLFGVTSGLIFRSMNPNAAEYIYFDKDSDGDESSAGADGTPQDTSQEASGNEEDPAADGDVPQDGEASGGENTEQTDPVIPSPTPEEAVTPTPTPEPTPEELRAMQIGEYKELFSTMCSIAEEAEKSVVTVLGITSTEDWFDTVAESRKSVSGLIIADTGSSYLILTDQSVTADSERLAVVWNDGTMSDAAVLGTDQWTSLTVLTVTADSVSDAAKAALKVADLGNSYLIKRGQPVIAVGRPVGTDNGLGFGEVTSTGDSVGVTDARYTLVTTDIFGSTDGSGFIIDLDGRFIGVIKEAMSPAGSNTVAALAISPIKQTIELLSNSQPLPYLGIRGENVTAELSSETGIPVGVYVTGIEPDSPAASAGLQIADVITALNGDVVTGMETYQRFLITKKPDENVALTVQRLGPEGYVPLEFTITVAGR